MSQHFLLSAKARTISVRDVARLGEEEAYALFKSIRFAANEGQPYCPHCGLDAIYEYRARRLFKCQNLVKDRKSDGRKQFNTKRRSIVTARERRPGGRSRAWVVPTEKAADPYIKKFVSPDAHVVTDESPAYSRYFRHFADHSTVNHSVGLMVDGVHTNMVEAQHSRIRRAERGVYLHISGAHLNQTVLPSGLYRQAASQSSFFGPVAKLTATLPSSCLIITTLALIPGTIRSPDAIS